MVSEFQNRLIGIVILIMIGIIVLFLLEEKKQHVKEHIISIPLMPEFKVLQSNNKMSSIISSPSIELLTIKKQICVFKNTLKLIKHTTLNMVIPSSAHQLLQFRISENNFNVKTSEKLKQKLVQLKSIKLFKQVNRFSDLKNVVKNQSYIIQLGALKNTDKVNDIVTQLRLFGYHIFTVPLTPRSSQTTRIYVGPDVLKVKLQHSLDTLRESTGLNGIVRSYR